MLQVNRFSSFQYADDDDLIEQEDEDITYSLYPPSFQETYETDLAEDTSIEVVPVVIHSSPVPLLLTGEPRVNTTGPLAADRDIMPARSAQRPETTTWPFELDDLPEPEAFTEPLVTTTGQFNLVSGNLPAPLTESPVTSTGQFKVISGVLPGVFEQQPGANTGQLAAAPAQFPIFVATPELAASLQAAVAPGTSRRVVVIPGSKKRKQAEMETTPSGERMHPRLRKGVTLAAALLVMVITSMLTLGHLASGQYPFPIFSSFNSWFQSNSANQQFAVHLNTAQINARTLPPMNLPRSPYVAIAQQDAIAAGIPAEYFVRQINQESGFNPNSVSPAGAEGIAQFMPGTAAGLGINPWDPIQALRAAAHLMASYTHQYGGDYARSLAAYNAGTGAVLHASYVCGSSWMNCLPAETRNYIYVIMGI